MGMKEDSEGRVIIDCTTLLPNSASFPAEVVKIGGGVVKEEALVTALDVRVLHKRVGHLGKVGMECKAAPKQVRHAQEAHSHSFINTQDNEC